MLNTKMQIPQYLSEVKGLAKKTVSGHYNNFNKLVSQQRGYTPEQKKEVKTLKFFVDYVKGVGEKTEDFKKWVDNLRDLKVEHKDENGDMVETNITDGTVMNYLKAFKGIGREYKNPRTEWGGIADRLMFEKGIEKHEAMNLAKECTYLEGCENFIKFCDMVFNMDNKEDVKKRTNHVKSTKQEKNWVDWSAINDIAKNYKKFVKDVGVDMTGGIKKARKPSNDEVTKVRQLKMIQKAILAHIFGGISENKDLAQPKSGKINPPRRTDIIGHMDKNQQMQPLRWGDMVEDGDTTTNLLKLVGDNKGKKWGHWEFHLYHHKEVEHHGTYILKITDKPTIKLIHAMRTWNNSFGNNNTDVWLQSQGEEKDAPRFKVPFNTNNIIKIIKSIFDHDGKSISIDMIRCIWKTTFIKPLYQAIEQDNTSMGHTEKVGKTYIKN